jgi:hypothetical protein
LTSTHQNKLKTQKKKKIEVKKKNLNFFKNAFETQKQKGSKSFKILNENVI